MCGDTEEKINRFGLPSPKNVYIHRHKGGQIYIHWNLDQHYRMTTEKRCYRQKPGKVRERERNHTMRYANIHRERKANSFQRSSRKTCILINVSIPKKEDEKNIL